MSSPNSSTHAFLCCLFSPVPSLSSDLDHFPLLSLFSPSSLSSSSSLFHSDIHYRICIIMSDSAAIITYIGFALTIISVAGLSWSLRSNHRVKEELRERLEAIKRAVDTNVGIVRILNGATRALADRIIKLETRLAAQDIEARAAQGTAQTMPAGPTIPRFS